MSRYCGLEIKIKLSVRVKHLQIKEKETKTEREREGKVSSAVIRKVVKLNSKTSEEAIRQDNKNISFKTQSSSFKTVPLDNNLGL